VSNVWRGGARRSRRFNPHIESVPADAFNSPQGTLKRAEARAPLLDCARFNKKALKFKIRRLLCSKEINLNGLNGTITLTQYETENHSVDRSGWLRSAGFRLRVSRREARKEKIFRED
jgi:hypothetical protein